MHFNNYPLFSIYEVASELEYSALSTKSTTKETNLETLLDEIFSKDPNLMEAFEIVKHLRT